MLFVFIEMHGHLSEASSYISSDNFLIDENRNDFNNYVNSKDHYNPHIMCIARPEILDKWFKDLFKWLFRCEKVFGLKNLKGYDQQRLYAYLAERYLSFWFKGLK